MACGWGMMETVPAAWVVVVRAKRMAARAIEVEKRIKLLGAFSLTLTLSRWEREQPLGAFLKFVSG